MDVLSQSVILTVSILDPMISIDVPNGNLLALWWPLSDNGALLVGTWWNWLWIQWTSIMTSWSIIHHSPLESTNTTSMEDVSTRVLEKINNIEEVNIKPKHYMMYQEIYNCICQNTKKWRYTTQYVKPTAQLVFKNRFPMLLKTRLWYRNNL